MDSGYLSETELGIIGGSLFFSYAVGKFVNGFFCRSFQYTFFNVRRVAGCCAP